MATAELSNGISIVGAGTDPGSIVELSRNAPFPAFAVNAWRSPWSNPRVVAVEGVMTATLDVPDGEKVSGASLTLFARAGGSLSIAGDRNNPARAGEVPLLIERIPTAGHSANTPGEVLGSISFPMGSTVAHVELDATKLTPGENILRIRVDATAFADMTVASFAPGGVGGGGFTAAELDYETESAVVAVPASAEDDALMFVAQAFGISVDDPARLRAFVEALAQVLGLRGGS